MAPAAVQTKQSVSAYSTCAPALFTQASMAGAFTPSRSPITSTRLPLSFIGSPRRSRIQEKRDSVRRFGHAAEEQTALRHEQHALHLAVPHRPEGVRQVADGRG